MFFYDTVVLFFYLNHLLMENLAIYTRFTVNLICDLCSRYSVNLLPLSKNLLYGPSNSTRAKPKSKAA